MTHFQKSRLYPILRWGFANLSPNIIRENPISSNSYSCFCRYNVHYQVKNCSTISIKVDENDDIEESSTSANGETSFRMSPTTRKEAQGALLDYLHSTRNLPFMDAEYLSKNSPKFLRKLIGKVSFEADVRRSVARFLRYHPINEFEPFFESIGLDPSEFVPRLPRNWLFLSDEDGLLSNYSVLCEYGVARNSLGKIYRKAREVFRYDDGVLKSKLRGFEEMGLIKPVIAKAVSFNPYLLIDDVGKEFFKMLSKLQCLGCDYDWVEHYILKECSYNWRQIIELLNMLNDMGCEDKDLRNLLRQHPELLFDRSGRSTYTLIGFLLKFGSSKNDICSLFLHFPKVRVKKFIWNLGRAYEFFSEIEMDPWSTGSIMRTHFMMLGSGSMKKANSILANLSIGKRRLCEYIISNPLELKNWVLRAKVERLPEDRKMRARRGRIKFLARIGFAEDSKEMERALKVYRGKAEELYDRFDCLVKAGVSEEDAAEIVKAAPHVLNQTKEVLEAKMSYLVDDLGHPLSSLKPFPGYLAYTIERVKLRCTMYKWLSNQGVVRPNLTLSTIIGCTESTFLKKYVNKHPDGLDVWQNLKKKISV